MPKTRKILLKPQAEKDLENIYRYSCNEFGLKRTDEYMGSISTAFHRLAEEPGQAKKYDHIKPGLMALPVISHIVFFRVTDAEITVVRVLHKSMDYQSLFIR